MKSQAIAFIFYFFAAIVADAQISLERVALSRMDKGKWAKAEQSLKKSLRKDSVNAEAKYVYSQWYFDNANPDFQIDSAYRFTLASLEDYQRADQRQRDRMLRFPLDSNLIVAMRQKIDSAAFERAKDVNTESSYIRFLEAFSYAKERTNAIELRDEVAFLDALKTNTYQSFNHYLSKYPDSHRAEEAKSRYDKLLFEDKTRDGRLNNYIMFYNDYPSSPYRETTIKQIFEISTASGEVEDYVDFIKKYGATQYGKKEARDIAYHIARDLNLPAPAQIFSDSLRRAIRLEKGYWVPFLKNGKYGFMDENGNETLPERFSDIDSEYLCGNIVNDFLITSQGVVSRTGKMLITGTIDNVSDLGLGVLLVEEKNCANVIHKSGFKIIEGCVEEARVIADHFIAVKQKGGWGLHAITGMKIVEDRFEDINAVEEIIVFTKNGKKNINTIEQVIRAADKNPLPDKMVFDEVRKISTDKILVKNGSLEGIVNSELKFEIPLDRQTLTLTSFGFTKRFLNKVTTVGVSNVIDNEEFTDIQPYLNWLGLLKPGDIKLYHMPSAQTVDRDLDSLWFTNRLAMALKNDSVKVLFGSGRKMMFPITAKVTFINSPDSVRYFLIEEKGKKQIYDVDTGTRRFVLEFDNIEDVGYNLFLIEQKGKKGLVGLDGKQVLPVEYDAIVRSSGHILSLLKDKKFGMYDLRTKTLVKANYERNLSFFSESVLVGYKDGYYGFIKKDTSPISEFEFDEIKPWSDSSAFVKKNFRWMVYDIYTQEIGADQIKDYRLLRDGPEEKIAIIHKGNEYGIISNLRGSVVPATFSDIINVGTAEKPFYFTEKNVEEADIFVVIYYDEHGKMIRRQIYEADEYDRIYCR